jgi:hypothetical protein
MDMLTVQAYGGQIKRCDGVARLGASLPKWHGGHRVRGDAGRSG